MLLLFFVIAQTNQIIFLLMKKDTDDNSDKQENINDVISSKGALSSRFLKKQSIQPQEGMIPNAIQKTSSNTSQKSKRLDNFRVPTSFRSSLRQISLNFNKGNGRQSLIDDFNYDVLNWMLVSARCELCQRLPKQPKISLCNCTHTFCSNCLKMYVIYKINSSQEIKCPQQNCENKADSQISIFKELPDKLKEKYQQQKIWRQAQQNSNIRLCPRQGCINGIVDLLTDPPICNKCHKTFCKECELEAHQGPCQKKFEEIFNDWKRCPKCHIFIQKTQGCNHMTCKCEHQFCYVCLADWQNSHYECGQVDLVEAWINQEVQLPTNPCIKFFQAILMIIVFPFLIVLYTAGLMVALALGIVGGIVIVPIVFCAMASKGTSSADGIQILCVLSLIVGCLIGAGVAVYYYCLNLNPYILRYLKIISSLCSC